VTFTVLTLFPDIVDAYFANSIMAKAISRGVVACRSINIRDYATDKHHKCDDAPYGGGAGMLMLSEPLGRALEAAGARSKIAGVGNSEAVPESGAAAPEPAAAAGTELAEARPRVVFLTPSGRPFNQALAAEFARERDLILLCGRYEGIDQRIIDAYVDDEVSIGDYVLSSGEVAALAVIDATYRLVDGVITAESLTEESFSDGLLEYPQYTRPELYGTLRVPEVLLSGHHEHIRRWRLRKRLEKTLRVRPELIRSALASGAFDAEMRAILQELQSPSCTSTGSEGDEHERDQGD
jgi:tRNA (guanine37-N1)-methyltransferase